MKKYLLAIGLVLGVSVTAAFADEPPSMATGSLRGDNRSRAECLDYSLKVLRVLGDEQITTTKTSVYGSIGNGVHVIRCETEAHTVFLRLLKLVLKTETKQNTQYKS